ncbi:MAG: NAD(P)-dependent oxidoreductase, partial [Opitutales bacterium]|nr:NAD(P)-dependent oxidoreductase [Opitutales bacterium]
ILATENVNLTWLEMSTIDPEVSKGLSKICQSNGIRFLDTAIGGLTVDAEMGKLLFMVGGTDEDFDIASGFLAHLGRCVHCGPTGTGVTIKLINNQLAGVTLAAPIEALLIGRQAGLRFKDMKEILSETAAANAHLHRALPQRIIPRDFDDGFSIDLMIKDAGLAIDLAERLESSVKLGKLVQGIRQEAIGKGWNAKDTTIIAKIFEEMANEDLDFEA